MKPIRILHTSDFHMDSPFESLSEGKAAIRRAELRQLPQKIARLAAAEQVNLVLLCGDLLDSDSAFKETGEELINMQNEAEQVFASDAIINYILDLCEATRRDPDIPNPLSPRAALALLSVSRAYAYANGRNFVAPDDVQTLFPHIAEHRLRKGNLATLNANTFSTKILHKVTPNV